MKKNKQRLAALLLALSLVLTLAAPAAAADSDEIHIRTAQDLADLSQSCSVDSWSVGKSVYLDVDIDLAGVDFQPIPTFGGTFYGQGHTISGFSLTGSGSERGFFRYVQAGAVIQDLTVTGSVTPSDQKDSIGGLAGVNSGQLINCAFQGNVRAGTNAGGLVGYNLPTGQLINCTYAGTLLGEHYVGGIVGRNEGSVIRCQNDGDVNTTEVKTTVAIHEVDLSTIRSTENAPACTDIGGIAGSSSGILQSCTNTGDVGYEHVGYNVGGIAGRQSGWLDSCVNTGTVRGRKDVGGICGQMEPRLTLLFDPNSLDDLWAELDTLQDLMDQALSHAEGSSEAISAQMTGMTDSADEVRQAASDLSGAMTEWADGNIATINDVSARIAWALDRLTPIADSMDDALGRLQDAASLAGDALAELERMGALAEDAVADLERALDRVGDSAQLGSQALDLLRSAFDRLRNGLGQGDAGSAAMGDVEEAAADLTAAFARLSEALDELWNQMGEIGSLPDSPEPGQDDAGPDTDEDDEPDTGEDMSDGEDGETVLPDGGIELPDWDGGDWNGDDVDWEAVQAALAELRDAADQIETALEALGDALGGAGSAAGDTAGNSLQDIADAAEKLHEGFRVLEQAADHMADAFDTLDSAAPHGASAASLLREAVDALEEACGGLREAGETFGDVMSELADQPAISFTPVGEAVSEKGDALDDALGGLSAAMEGLNGAMASSSQVLLEDLRAINRQFGRVIDVLRKHADDEETVESEEDLLEDVSDEATETDEDAGRITNSENTGAVEGDVNVAGIVGSMAIEYDYDPEDDLTTSGDRSLRFHYQAAALTEGCVNNGPVTGKKDYVGGIVGRMDLGTVSQCESYAPVESTGGDYVGGIAGAAWSTLRDCWAKCALSGKDYIGGIAGLGSTVTDCRALVEIDEGSACLGAVLGDLAEDGQASGNLFTHDTLGGIGGISYAGQAEPAEFQVLSQGAPAAFTRFRLVFRAGDEVVETVDFSYGDSLTQLPEIPAREGCSASWPDMDYDCLTFSRTLDAEYTAYASALTALGDPPEIVVEGTFSSEASLSAESAEDTWTDDGGTAHTGAVYTVTVEDPVLTPASFQVQCRLPEGWTGAAVWVSSPEGWTQQEAETDGSYIVFTAEGDSVTFALQEEAGGDLTILLTAAVCAAVVGLVVVVWKKHRKNYVGRHDSGHAKPESAD